MNRRNVTSKQPTQEWMGWATRVLTQAAVAPLRKMNALVAPTVQTIRQATRLVRIRPTSPAPIPVPETRMPLGERAQSVLRATGPMATAVLAQQLGVPQEAMQQSLMAMRKQGRVALTGWARGARWTLRGKK